jgi:hypothetical protein
MLYTFTSKVHSDVVMFGNVATVLLRAMGQKEEPPGILRGEAIREAATKLRAWLDEAPKDLFSKEEEAKAKTDEERAELRNRVGFRIRATPLLDMLDASYAKDADVIWR